LVEAGTPLPLDADMVLLPGSKSTIADLDYLRQQGWDIDLKALMRHGTHVVGLCGGYQMMGRQIHDPDGIEGRAGSVEGLGFLDIETTLAPQKTVQFSNGVEATTGQPVSGYEIHLGCSTGPDTETPMVTLADDRVDGAVGRGGQVMGCYMHGIFASDAFRSSWLTGQGHAASSIRFEDEIEKGLDALADHLEAHVDIDGIARIAGLAGF
jgi:adenosylcobyric acid synthase